MKITMKIIVTAAVLFLLAKNILCAKYDNDLLQQQLHQQETPSFFPAPTPIEFEEWVALELVEWYRYLQANPLALAALGYCLYQMFSSTEDDHDDEDDDEEEEEEKPATQPAAQEPATEEPAAAEAPPAAGAPPAADAAPDEDETNAENQEQAQEDDQPANFDIDQDLTNMTEALVFLIKICQAQKGLDVTMEELAKKCPKKVFGLRYHPDRYSSDPDNKDVYTSLFQASNNLLQSLVNFAITCDLPAGGTVADLIDECVDFCEEDAENASEHINACLRFCRPNISAAKVALKTVPHVLKVNLFTDDELNAAEEPVAAEEPTDVVEENEEDVLAENSAIVPYAPIKLFS